MSVVHLPGKLPNSLVEDFGKKLIHFHLTNSGILTDTHTERMWAEVNGISDYQKSHEVIDVNQGFEIGWSVKGRYVKDPFVVDTIDYKLTTRFYEKGQTPKEIGHIYLDNWADILQNARDQYKSVRTVVILNEKSHQKVALVEFPSRTWNADEYIWKWSSEEKTTVHGLNFNNEKRFAIYLNDSRLWVWHPIGQRSCFYLPSPLPRITEESILTAAGFNLQFPLIEVLPPLSITPVYEEHEGEAPRKYASLENLFL